VYDRIASSPYYMFLINADGSFLREIEEEGDLREVNPAR
jgi:hypothetical protein